MSDKENIKEIINLCWDSTNESKVGPILQMKEGYPKINDIGLHTFYTILSNVLPNNVQTQQIIPKEPWQSES